MTHFANPLDKIKVASPCAADWNEMFGDERRRFCAECKLNLYNLSGMTKIEAESLLINSEGSLCVRFYRRTDGTILTEDCPVGLAKIKQRVSRIATAAFSMIAAFFSGFAAFVLLTNINQDLLKEISVEDESINKNTEKYDTILLETDELTNETYSRIQATVGKVLIDPSQFSHVRKNRQKSVKY